MVELVQSKGDKLTIRDIVDWFLTSTRGTVADAIALRDEEVVLIDIAEIKKDQEREGPDDGHLVKGFPSLFWAYLFFAVYGYVHIAEKKPKEYHESQRVMEILQTLRT